MSEKNKSRPKPVEIDPIAAKALADAKAEVRKQQAVNLRAYDNWVNKMSFQQLRGELRQASRKPRATAKPEVLREGREPRDTSLLASALATIFLTVLENTKTKENPFGRLSEYPR